MLVHTAKKRPELFSYMNSQQCPKKEVFTVYGIYFYTCRAQQVNFRTYWKYIIWLDQDGTYELAEEEEDLSVMMIQINFTYLYPHYQ